MNPPFSGSIRDQAQLWAIRLGDDAFDDWDGFTAWLEENPVHSAAYDMAVAHDAAIVETLRAAPRPIMPVVQPVPSRVSRRAWVGGAMAAAVAGLVGFATLRDTASPYVVETGPGVHRTVTLADGSSIMLNGGTRLVLDHTAPRRATLERGEALFTVRHDDRDPFELKVGGTKLVDVGTVFNVVRDASATRLSVSEGAVVYAPDTDAVRLDAGQALIAADGARPIRTQVETTSVGAWRSGQLVYSNALLTTVAADLSRNLGKPVDTIADVGGVRFTGIINLDTKAADPIAPIAPLLGVRAQRNALGWTLTRPDRAPR
ncbi:FecR family protein [Sphingomonas alpina]|uniref:FecR domain-containing protein n=1 Tax=Sphingomonas alpina TaxID=653931 RepID=A0A7H0LKM8_9SPHN|nr:FecR domain-containing protein [Sphingomonas alpina]QNQ10231.1 FecR domain-containing protein [Sphingomonas alpina]